MESGEFIDRFMLPTDSQAEIQRLSWLERRLFVKTGRELGIKAVFGARINEKDMRSHWGNLSAARLALGLNIEPRFLNNDGVYMGPYILTDGRRRMPKIYQVPGVMLYAVENGNNESE